MKHAIYRDILPTKDDWYMITIIILGIIGIVLGVLD